MDVMNDGAITKNSKICRSASRWRGFVSATQASEGSSSTRSLPNVPSNQSMGGSTRSLPIEFHVRHSHIFGSTDDLNDGDFFRKPHALSRGSSARSQSSLSRCGSKPNVTAPVRDLSSIDYDDRSILFEPFDEGNTLLNNNTPRTSALCKSSAFMS